MCCAKTSVVVFTLFLLLTAHATATAHCLLPSAVSCRRHGSIKLITHKPQHRQKRTRSNSCDKPSIFRSYNIRNADCREIKW